MGYTLQEQYTSKNQVPGANANTVWNRGVRKVSSITIHHWGNKGQQFGTVRDFLCTNNVPTSAHYVVQDGLVACIVSPDDCAFHAGNAEGNSHSIGIECRPEATDGDYATIAELIRDLRGIYGDIPLVPHKYWYATACPGEYDLARLDSLARGTTITVQSATTEEDDMALSQEDKDLIQAMHDVTRGFIVDQSQKQHEATRNLAQAMHDVTRAYLRDTNQDVEEVTRKVLADTFAAAATDPSAVVSMIPGEIVQQVLDGLTARLSAAAAVTK